MKGHIIATVLGLTLFGVSSVEGAPWEGLRGPVVPPLPPSNPLFPERIGIPWIAVPQPTANPQAPGMQAGSKQPSLSSVSTDALSGAVNDGPLRFPTSLKPVGKREFPEILYAGNVPIQQYPLPLNAITSRLQSFGFLIQFPTIVLPKPVGQ